jgi:hypothetical protein
MSEQIAVQPTTATNQKLQIAGDIGRMETDVAKAESTQREMERKLQSAKGNRTAGAAALLIGLVMLLFLGGILAVIGVFLAIIGGLTLLTSIAKQSNAQSQLKAQETQIADMRGKLAELRAQLAIL